MPAPTSLFYSINEETNTCLYKYVIGIRGGSRAFYTYHITADNVPLKSELFTKTVEESKEQ